VEFAEIGDCVEPAPDTGSHRGSDLVAVLSLIIVKEAGLMKAVVLKEIGVSKFRDVPEPEPEGGSD